MGLGERQQLALAAWADAQIERQAARLAQRELRVVWTARDDARGDQPRRTRPRRRDVPNQATEDLTDAEWKALLAAADNGRLEDADA